MLKITLHLVWRGLNHLSRIVMLGTIVFALLCGVLMLGLRYWILPDIERYHDTITASITSAIGLPVSIGKIEADWHGMRPHLLLSDVRILDKGNLTRTALVLQQIDGVVSWTTLLWGEIRLHSIELDQPDLQVRRDVQGLLHIAGVALSNQSPGSQGLADWLLHQGSIVIRDARITWLDEQRATPPLVFNHLNLFIDNGIRRHRFSMQALPPPELSARLDVRGDFYGQSFEDLAAWRGQLFTQLDYIDVAAWRFWLPLPVEIKRGAGALRGWLEVADGKIKQVTADLALANVQAQLAENLLPLDLHTLRGRLNWAESAQGFEIATQQLFLKTEGVTVHPTNFFLRMNTATGKQTASGEVRANTLELANLVSLTESLPLSQELKKQLAEFAPKGTVFGLQAKWQGEADKPTHYEVKARFDQLSMKRVGKLPGFGGLSGELDGSETSGTLSLNARKLTLDAPQIMPDPLAFDTLSGQGSWRVDKQGTEVKFSNVAVNNKDLAGTVYGSFQTLPNSPGLIDLNINLTRAAINHADSYIPLEALDQPTHAWLRSALLDGHADEFHLRLSGNLNDFPFAENKKGVFQIQARIRGGMLGYDKDWPRIENITGELLIQGKRLEVNAPFGTTAGTSLQRVRVTIPDMASPELMLKVRGEASGETARSLDFIQQSPVHGYIDDFTEGMTARGTGNLQLSVDVPLRGNKPVTVSGMYHFSNNELNLGGGVPVLFASNGDLLFTESSLNTKNLSAQILGGPATLVLQSGATGEMQARVHGRANMDALRKKLPHPLLSRLHGGADWDAEITVKKKLANVLVTSNLYGLISDLPAPFSKNGGEVVPLRFEMKDIDAKQEQISLQYGKLLSAKLLRREESNERIIKRGTINFGNSGKWLNRDGIWLTGVVPHLSLEGWGGLFISPGENDSGGASSFSIAGADLIVQRLEAFGYSTNGLHLNARNQGGVLATHLASKEVNGELSWQAEGKGKLVARLRNLNLGKVDKGSQSEVHAGNVEDMGRKSNLAEDSGSTEFPALDLVVDELTWKDKQLGKMELQAQQHGHDWLLERMRLTNPDGALTADGKYSMVGGKTQTEVNLKLEIANAGKMLARSGFPDSVKNGSGKLEGAFSWRGAPDEFSYAALDGKLTLDTGKGQFLKIEPGIGKLLGILSLQALPKHITLDFTDIFSDGFAFDNIAGTALLKQGVLTTSDFKIDGSSAKITMKGQVDLNRETQNLRVRILPTVGNSVSLLGAFAAGPLVGIGTFLVNKILREPLDKLVSFEYNVTGTWVNPNVTKIGKSPAGVTGKESNP